MRWKFPFFAALCAVFVFHLACSDTKDENESIPEYDPNKKVTIARFLPDSGGIAEQFVLHGSNFGNDVSKIKLFFNKERASIISCKGDKLLALAPKLPGDTCIITLKIGNQEILADKTFRYISRMTVSSVAGSPGANGGNFSAGTLADGSFANIRNVVADSYGNIFVSQYGAGTTSQPGSTNGISRINIPGNSLSWLVDVAAGVTAWNNPVIDRETDIIYYPGNSSGAVLEINPLDLWTPRLRRLKAPIEGGAPQWTTWGTSHSLALHSDGSLYIRDYNGIIAKIDPKTWIADMVGGRAAGTIDPTGKSDSYLAISPLDPDWLYISYNSFHKVRRFHLRDHIFEDFVGAGGTGGWKDGVGSDARFNNPRAICFDSKGILYVADYTSHCIRRVTPDREVSTLAGVPGTKGYQDGAPQVALFNNPWGICVDKDDNIYVADATNRVVRKITLE